MLWSPSLFSVMPDLIFLISFFFFFKRYGYLTILLQCIYLLLTCIISRVTIRGIVVSCVNNLHYKHQFFDY